MIISQNLFQQLLVHSSFRECSSSGSYGTYFWNKFTPVKSSTFEHDINSLLLLCLFIFPRSDICEDQAKSGDIVCTVSNAQSLLLRSKLLCWLCSTITEVVRNFLDKKRDRHRENAFEQGNSWCTQQKRATIPHLTYYNLSLRTIQYVNWDFDPKYMLSTGQLGHV